MSLGMRVALFAAAAAIVGIVIFGLAGFNTESEPLGIWSAEHGHYH